MVRTTATLTITLLAALLRGAVGRCDPSCPPRVVVDPGVPTRLAARLRAQFAALPPAEAHCGELLFRWDRSRLVIEVALQDGRVARRTLRSLEDALPTALAVLATPPHDDEAPAAGEAAAPAAPAPMAPAPVARTAPAPPAPVTPTTPPASGLRLRVEGGMGGGWSHGRGFFAQRGEVALVWGRAVVAVNGQWRSGDEAPDGSEVRGQRFGFALRWRSPVDGRWDIDLGAVIAAASLRRDDGGVNARGRGSVWSLAAGADASASLRLTRALHAVARAEALATVLHFGDDPDGLYGGAPVSLSMTLGLRLEVSP
jgi:hypothetical protein